MTRSLRDIPKRQPGDRIVFIVSCAVCVIGLAVFVYIVLGAL